MDIEQLFEYGYLGLFLISFLAATLVPLATEFFVVSMPTIGYDVWGVLIVATAGNVLGSITNYYVGKMGGDFVLSRYINIKPETMQRAQTFYGRWGPVALFFSWVPFIGDPLTVLAGTLRLDFRVFLFWVFLGKFLRYILLLGVASQLLEFS